MSRNDGDEKFKPKHGYRWKKGVSGNPAGRPKGTGKAQAATKLLESIGTDSATDILESVIKAAKAGDMRAAEIILASVLFGKFLRS